MKTFIVFLKSGKSFSVKADRFRTKPDSVGGVQAFYFEGGDPKTDPADFYLKGSEVAAVVLADFVEVKSS